LTDEKGIYDKADFAIDTGDKIYKWHLQQKDKKDV